MKNETIYRCTKQCPINKKCFILKVKTPLEEPIEILLKCAARHGKDISIVIGDKLPPKNPD